ncbi:MAG: hypothetical protein H0V10_09095 [Geodermatophilaceae bacterium]|nr:hypothetical protein [Geodermatophilaceae bacterium]
MGLWARLMGREQQPVRGGYDEPDPGRPDDEQAIERYRYLLRTSPPNQIEQAHAEAFATLTLEQRQEVLVQLGAEVPPGERAQSDDPQALARMATRAEMRQPGTLERTLGAPGGMGFGGVGMGMGGMFAGSLLASVAGAFIGTAIAGAMFDAAYADAGTEASAADDTGSEYGDSTGGDSTSGDNSGGGDWGGGGGGDWGSGDAGGGDWGSGDFGGGDFGGGI